MAELVRPLHSKLFSVVRYAQAAQVASVDVVGLYAAALASTQAALASNPAAALSQPAVAQQVADTLQGQSQKGSVPRST